MSRAGTPTLGYPSLTAAVDALKQQGFPPRAIAAQIGCEIAKVTSVLKNARERERLRKPAPGAAATVTLPPDLVAALRPHAEVRGMPPAELARKIVEEAVKGGLIDAVLDDGGAA